MKQINRHKNTDNHKRITTLSRIFINWKLTMQTTTIKSDKSSKCEVCGLTLAGLSVAGLAGFAIYNFIITIIAVISFTNNDVEDVCPNSELWWWALFIGIIWPFLLSNGAKNAAESKEESMPFFQVFVWICMLTSFIIWAWDQLWGVPGFANDTCAMDNFGTYNSTDGADNDGYKLFTAVQMQMYLYMIIDAIFVLGICGIGGCLVVGSYQDAKKDSGTSASTDYRSNESV